MSLLSSNDRKALRNALREGREMSLERQWSNGRERIRATVTPASPAWDVPYILRIDWWRGVEHSHQYGSEKDWEGVLF